MKLLRATGASDVSMSLILSHRLVRACMARSTKPRIGIQVRVLP